MVFMGEELGRGCQMAKCQLEIYPNQLLGSERETGFPHFTNTLFGGFWSTYFVRCIIHYSFGRADYTLSWINFEVPTLPFEHITAILISSYHFPMFVLRFHTSDLPSPHRHILQKSLIKHFPLLQAHGPIYGCYM